MKTTALLTFLLAGSMSLSAYTPLVEEGKQWSVISHGDIFIGGVDYRYSTKLHKIEGEESVNGVKYNKLLSTSNKEADDWSTTALLREEDKKVYALVNGKEYLMFDYNIEVGSKIAIYPSLDYIFYVDKHGDENLGAIECEVSKIETVKNKKGEDIKKYSFKDILVVFYERYGSETGWMFDFNVVGDYSDRLVCVHNPKGELEFFSKPPFEGVTLEEGECYAWGEVRTAVNETEALTDAVFYDNAARSIGISLDGEKEITVYDMQGKEVFHTSTADNTVAFTANSGLYIVKAVCDGNSFTGKIMVE